jgi:hypothetical protein
MVGAGRTLDSLFSRQRTGGMRADQQRHRATMICVFPLTCEGVRIYSDSHAANA